MSFPVTEAGMITGVDFKKSPKVFKVAWKV